MNICEPNIDKEDIEAVVKCLENNELSGRTAVCDDFERAFAEKMGVKFAIAVNSGTSALFIALKALGIGPGDEVIVPDFSFIAVANAVSHTGATPILVDSEPYTLNIMADKIKITPKTKAIIAVHTYGIPCDMATLKSYGVPVIEDAAEAIGAEVEGFMAGSQGDIGCFSFFANKVITTGEGGMVVTNYEDIAKEIKLLKDQYRTGQYMHNKVGYGMSMGAMQCALGASQLKKLDEHNLIKKRIADKYTKELSNYGNSSYIKRAGSFWMYPYNTPNAKTLMDYLARFDIETRPGFVPIHTQKMYKQYGTWSSDAIYKTTVCLPCGIKLTEEEQDFIITKIKAFYD